MTAGAHLGSQACARPRECGQETLSRVESLGSLHCSTMVLGGCPVGLSLTGLLLRGLNEMMCSACSEQCSEKNIGVFREEYWRVQRLFAALIINPRSSLLVLWGSSLEPRIFHRWGSGRLAVAAAPEGWG